MSQLSGRQSLRDIEVNISAQEHKLYHLDAKPVAKCSLARVNEKLKAVGAMCFERTISSSPPAPPPPDKKGEPQMRFAL